MTILTKNQEKLIIKAIIEWRGSKSQRPLWLLNKFKEILNVNSTLPLLDKG